MRKRGRTDSNQAQIVRELRQLGASVEVTSSLGHGFPDLAVGIGKRNFFFEVKDGMLPPSKKRLTTDERDWHKAWHGQVHVIESAEDAIRVIESAKQWGQQLLPTLESNSTEETL